MLNLRQWLGSCVLSLILCSSVESGYNHDLLDLNPLYTKQHGLYMHRGHSRRQPPSLEYVMNQYQQHFKQRLHPQRNSIFRQGSYYHDPYNNPLYENHLNFMPEYFRDFDEHEDKDVFNVYHIKLSDTDKPDEGITTKPEDPSTTALPVTEPATTAATAITTNTDNPEIDLTTVEESTATTVSSQMTTDVVDELTTAEPSLPPNCAVDLDNKPCSVDREPAPGDSYGYVDVVVKAAGGIGSIDVRELDCQLQKTLCTYLTVTYNGLIIETIRITSGQIVFKVLVQDTVLDDTELRNKVFNALLKASLFGSFEFTEIQIIQIVINQMPDITTQSPTGPPTASPTPSCDVDVNNNPCSVDRRPGVGDSYGWVTVGASVEQANHSINLGDLTCQMQKTFCNSLGLVYNGLQVETFLIAKGEIGLKIYIQDTSLNETDLRNKILMGFSKAYLFGQLNFTAINIYEVAINQRPDITTQSPTGPTTSPPTPSCDVDVNNNPCSVDRQPGVGDSYGWVTVDATVEQANHSINLGDLTCQMRKTFCNALGLIYNGLQVQTFEIATGQIGLKILVQDTSLNETHIRNQILAGFSNAYLFGQLNFTAINIYDVVINQMPDITTQSPTGPTTSPPTPSCDVDVNNNPCSVDRQPGVRDSYGWVTVDATVTGHNGSIDVHELDCQMRKTFCNSLGFVYNGLQVETFVIATGNIGLKILIQEKNLNETEIRNKILTGFSNAYFFGQLNFTAININEVVIKQMPDITTQTPTGPTTSPPTPSCDVDVNNNPCSVDRQPGVGDSYGWVTVDATVTGHNGSIDVHELDCQLKKTLCNSLGISYNGVSLESITIAMSKIQLKIKIQDTSLDESSIRNDVRIAILNAVFLGSFNFTDVNIVEVVIKNQGLGTTTEKVLTTSVVSDVTTTGNTLTTSSLACAVDSSNNPCSVDRQPGVGDSYGWVTVDTTVTGHNGTMDQEEMECQLEKMLCTSLKFSYNGLVVEKIEVSSGDVGLKILVQDTALQEEDVVEEVLSALRSSAAFGPLYFTVPTIVEVVINKIQVTTPEDIESTSTVKVPSPSDTSAATTSPITDAATTASGAGTNEGIFANPATTAGIAAGAFVAAVSILMLGGYVFRQLTKPKKDPFDTLRKRPIRNPRGQGVRNASSHAASHPYYRSSNMPENQPGYSRLWRSPPDGGRSAPHAPQMHSAPYAGYPGPEDPRLPLDVRGVPHLYV